MRGGEQTSWRQWRALAGASLRSVEAPSRAVIDPEALVLLSLLVRSHERRLDDQLRWWSSEGAHWMSVQRMRTLAASFPPRIHDEVPTFAAMAVDAGDPRWKSLLDGSSHDPIGREGKSSRERLWLEPSTSMLRLRAAFSVGAKADLVAFLLGIASSLNDHASWATVDVISPAIA